MNLATKSQNAPILKTNKKYLQFEFEQSKESPKQQTQRLFNLHIQKQPQANLDLKQTERNYSKVRNNQILWLTQSMSSSSQSQEQWDIEVQSSHKKINEIQQLLSQYGLLELVTAFQDFMQNIADQLYNKAFSKMEKIQLIEIIESFKAKLEFKRQQEKGYIHDLEDFKMKELLEQISTLRCENARLKLKIREIQGEKNKKDKINNSIFNNSISFYTQNEESISHAEQSFDFEQSTHNTKPFLIHRDLAEQVSILPIFTQSLNNFQTDQISINCIQSFKIAPVHQSTQTQKSFTEEEQNNWIEITIKGTSSLKQIFEHYLIAANLALLRDQKANKELKKILQQTLDYQSKQSKNISELMKVANQFNTFIVNISKKIRTIIENKFQKLECKVYIPNSHNERII